MCHFFDIAYKSTHLIVLKCGSVLYRLFILHFQNSIMSKVQTYVIFTFFISLHVHGQPEHTLCVILQVNIVCMRTNKFNV